MQHLSLRNGRRLFVSATFSAFFAFFALLPLKALAQNTCSNVFTQTPASTQRFAVSYEAGTEVLKWANKFHPRVRLGAPYLAAPAAERVVVLADPFGYLLSRSDLADFSKEVDHPSDALNAEMWMVDRSGQGPVGKLLATTANNLERLQSTLTKTEFIKAKILALAKTPPAPETASASKAKNRHFDTLATMLEEAPTDASQMEQKMFEQLAVAVRYQLKRGYSEDESFKFVMKRTIKNFEIHRQYLSTSARPTLLLTAMLRAFDAHSDYHDPVSMQANEMHMSGKSAGVGLGFEVGPQGFEITSVREGSEAEKAGLKPGDRLRKIEGQDVSASEFSDLSSMLRGEEGTEVTLDVERAGHSLHFTVTRKLSNLGERVQTTVVDAAEGRVGVFKLREFSHGSADELIGAMTKFVAEKDGRSGIVLDLRGNGGGLIDEAMQIIQAFIPGELPLVAQSQKYKIKWTLGPKVKEILIKSPLLILVDGGSASASELVSGALQVYGRGLVVGSETFGKGTYQQVVPLKPEEMGGIRLTGGHYFLPDGTTPQSKGIQPDIAIPSPTGERYYHERDMPNAMPEIQTRNPLKQKTPMLPQRDAIVSWLNKRAEERRAGKPAMQATSDKKDAMLDETIEIFRNIFQLKKSDLNGEMVNP